MGEIADLMINGDICATCGEELGGQGNGFPRYCSRACRPSNSPEPLRGVPATKVSCPQCGRRVKHAGLKDHQRQAFG